MITRKQKSTVDTLKIKESKHTTTENHQITEEESKRRRKKQKNFFKRQKAINKMSRRTYLSIITLNVNEPNSPTKGQTVAD